MLVPLTGDREKATTMGFSPTMVAIKTYGLWTSIMANLVEGSFKQSMEESSRLERDLQEAKAKVVSLQADVRKYEETKSMLEAKVSKMSREAKGASARVKSLEGDLSSVKEQLETVEAKLKEVEAVSESERYETLRVAFEKLKLETLTSFDSGFHTAVAHIKVLHLGIDISGMDIDKIVVNGQLVDAHEEEELHKEVEQRGEDEVPFGSITGPREPPIADGVNDDPTLEHDLGTQNAEAVFQDVVMDSLDSEATL